MNVSIKLDAAQLAAELGWLVRQHKPAKRVPVLQLVHVQVVDDGLRLRGTNFDAWWETIVPASGAVADDTVVLISGKALAALVKGSKGDAVVTVSDTGVTVELGARTLSVPAATVDIGDYPTWLDFTTENSADIGVDAIKSVLAAVGTDDTLPMLTGVRFDSTIEHGATMTTTDRFRLTTVTYGPDGLNEVLVPQGLLRAFTVGKGGPVSVAVGSAAQSRYVRVSRGGRSVIGRPLDAEFPKWRRLLEGVEGMRFEVHTADLLAALAGDNTTLEFRPAVAACGFSGCNDGRGGDTTIGVSARMHTDAAVVVSSQTVAAVDHTGGDPLTIRFCTEYLRSLLKASPTETVRLTVNTPARPMLISAGDVTNLLMPIRIPG